MDNQEKQRDMEQEEKAIKLFELLQNVPEDLLERSDKHTPGVIMFVQKYKTTLVACLVLLLVGVGVLGYRSVGGMSDSTGNEAAMNKEWDGAMGAEKQEIAEEAASEEAVPEEAEPEYGYVADNDVVAGMFQESLKDTGSLSNGSGTTEQTESATSQTDGADATGPQGLAAKMSQMDIAEGYEYQSITSAVKDGREVLAIRLQGGDGKYMELIMQSAEAVKEPVVAEEDQLRIADTEGNAVALTEDADLPADGEGIVRLKATYGDGMTVEYNGIADAPVVYRILNSLR